MILELELEPPARGAMLRALVEHVADVGGERHEPDQVLAEEPLALLGAALREHPAGGGQLDAAVLEFGEFQNVQSLGDRKEVVDLESERRAISARSA